MVALKFKDFRELVSKIDRVSVCTAETFSYENYKCIEDVPDKYNEKFVIGVGVIDSEVEEFFNFGKTCKEWAKEIEHREDISLHMQHLEIVVANIPDRKAFDSSEDE